jgi:hypothetical protein
MLSRTNFRYYVDIFLVYWGKQRKVSNMLDGVPTEIRTGNFPTAIQVCCYRNQFVLWFWIVFLSFPIWNMGLISQFHWPFLQTVGLFWRVINSAQGLYLNTGQHKHRINAYTHTHTKHTCLEWDSNQRSRFPSEQPRPLGCRDRRVWITTKLI